jgi:alpha-galactosidase
LQLERLGIRLVVEAALANGEPDSTARIDHRDTDGRTHLVAGLDARGDLGSIGVRFRASGVRQYLRNGYTSWDGSYFVEPLAAREVAAADPGITVGHAMTALLPAHGAGALVLGFLRHDRFQSRFRFSLEDKTC